MNVKVIELGILISDFDHIEQNGFFAVPTIILMWSSHQSRLGTGSNQGCTGCTDDPHSSRGKGTGHQPRTDSCEEDRYGFSGSGSIMKMISEFIGWFFLNRGF